MDFDILNASCTLIRKKSCFKMYIGNCLIYRPTVSPKERLIRKKIMDKNQLIYLRVFSFTFKKMFQIKITYMCLYVCSCKIVYP